MLGMQTQESFLEWNEDYASDSLERRRRGNTTSRNPVIHNIEKSAPRLGNYYIIVKRSKNSLIGQV